MKRYSKHLHCPICDGHPELRSGRGIRCAGYLLDAVAYCTREEFAGRLPLNVRMSPAAYKHRLTGECGCGLQHGRAVARVTPSRRTAGAPGEGPRLSVEVRDVIYSSALSKLSLRENALADLSRRGLPRDLCETVGYCSVPRKGNELRGFLEALRGEFGETVLRRCPGFEDKNKRFTFWCAIGDRDGYVVPYRDEQGRVTGLQMKLLGGKYLTATGTKVGEIYHVAGGPAPGGDLWVTEGGLKAQAASYHGQVSCIGVPGQALQPEHIEAVQRLQPARVIVAVDEEENRITDLVREKWCEAFWRAGLPTFRATWEGAL